MRSHFYSSRVVKGLKVKGYSDTAIANLIGATSAKIREILDQRSSLTSSQKNRIEKKLGLICGQLAALAVEPQGGPLTELMDEWGAFDRALNAVTSKTPTKRARQTVKQ